MKKTKFAISILALENLALTKKCVASVLKHSQDYTLILTDNGCTDGTAEWMRDLARAHSHVVVIHNEENLGFIKPMNHAYDLARRAGCTYFVALNNDTEVPAGWIDLMARSLDRRPLGALCGPPGSCQSLRDNFHGFAGTKLEYLEGSCLCAKIALVGTYLFSPYLDFAYGEDSDLSLRMQEKGYTIHHAQFKLVHHRSKTYELVKARCQEAQAHNHAVLVKRWATYLKQRSFNFPIIVNRRAALGDVLLITPLLKAINEAMPRNPLMVQTAIPELFERNPHIASYGKRIEARGAMVVDLDNAYEERPGMHVLEAYEAAVREMIPGLPPVSFHTEYHPDASHRRWAADKRRHWGDKVCLIHVGPTNWPGKNWPMDRWAEVASGLVAKGWHVVAVGNGTKPEVIRDCVNLMGQTSIGQLAALMQLCQLFIGIDSFPMHLAQSQGLPTIGLFGCTSHRYLMTHGSPHVGLDADPEILCAGERHRTRGQTFLQCDPSCIESIEPEQVTAAIRKLGLDAL